MNHVEVVVEQTANGYNVHPVHQTDFDGAVTVDLDVQVPKTANLTLHTSHGDINVSAIGGVVDARTENGDIEIHDAASDVFAQLQKGDARISGVGGNVTLKERGNDSEIADVVGDVTVEGPILGSTVVRKAGKTTRITSPWSNVTFEHLSGRLELDSSDIQLSDVAGPARIQTRNKDVNAENVGGPARYRQLARRCQSGLRDSSGRSSLHHQRFRRRGRHPPGQIEFRDRRVLAIRRGE